MTIEAQKLRELEHDLSEYKEAHDFLERKCEAQTERIERLREALGKGGFMMTEPHNVGEHRARKLVIGFENPDDADDAMQEIAAFLRGEAA